MDTAIQNTTTGKFKFKRVSGGTLLIACGAHCFSFFEGNDNFANYEDDTTTFFLTDFLCKHFEKFIWQEFGLDREESKTGLIFGNYKKVVYLAQTENAELKSKALEIADRLGLDFEYRYRGYSDLGVFIENIQ